MKRFLALLATGATIALGLSSSAFAQAGSFGAGSLILTNPLSTPVQPKTVTITSPQSPSPEYTAWSSAGFPQLTFSVPVPPAPGAQSGFLYSGPLTPNTYNVTGPSGPGTALATPYILPVWVNPGYQGFHAYGGAAGAWDYGTTVDLGLLSVCNTAVVGTIPVFTAGNQVCNSSITDNGTTVSTTENFNVTGTSQLNGNVGIGQVPGVPKLAVTGATTLTGSLNVTGASNIATGAGLTNNFGSGGTAVNTFGNTATNNQFGNNAGSNNFGNSATSNNQFGNGAALNQFGVSSPSNTMGTAGTSTNAINGTTNINVANGSNNTTSINTTSGTGAVAIGNTTTASLNMLAASATINNAGTGTTQIGNVAGFGNVTIGNNGAGTGQVNINSGATGSVNVTGPTNINSTSANATVVGETGANASSTTINVGNTGNLALNNIPSDGTTVSFLTSTGVGPGNISGNVRYNALSNFIQGNNGVLVTYAGGVATAQLGSANTGAGSVQFSSDRYINTNASILHITSAVAGNDFATFNGSNNAIALNTSGTGATSIGNTTSGGTVNVLSNGTVTIAATNGATGQINIGRNVGTLVNIGNGVNSGQVDIEVAPGTQAIINNGANSGATIIGRGGAGTGSGSVSLNADNANSVNIGTGGGAVVNIANTGTAAVSIGNISGGNTITGTTNINTTVANATTIGETGANASSTTINVGNTGNLALNNIANDNTTVSFLTTTGVGPGNISGNVRYNALSNFIQGNNGVLVSYTGGVATASLGAANTDVPFSSPRFLNLNNQSLTATTAAGASTIAVLNGAAAAANTLAITSISAGNAIKVNGGATTTNGVNVDVTPNAAAVGVNIAAVGVGENITATSSVPVGFPQGITITATNNDVGSSRGMTVTANGHTTSGGTDGILVQANMLAGGTQATRGVVATSAGLTGASTGGQFAATGTGGGAVIGVTGQASGSTASNIGGTFKATGANAVGVEAIADNAGAVPNQVIAMGATNGLQQMIMGYNTTGDWGSIQAVKQGVAVEPIYLNPAGGGAVGVDYAGGTALGFNLAVNGTIGATTNITDGGLTQNDIVFAGAGGLLSNNNAFTWNDGTTTFGVTGTSNLTGATNINTTGAGATAIGNTTGANNSATSISVGGTGNLTLNGIVGNTATTSLLTLDGLNNVRTNTIGNLVQGANGVLVTTTLGVATAQLGAANTDVLFSSDRYINTNASNLHITTGGPAGTDFAMFSGTATPGTGSLNVTQRAGRGVSITAAAVPADNVLRVQDNAGNQRFRVDQNFDVFVSDNTPTDKVALTAGAGNNWFVQPVSVGQTANAATLDVLGSAKFTGGNVGIGQAPGADQLDVTGNTDIEVAAGSHIRFNQNANTGTVQIGKAGVGGSLWTTIDAGQGSAVSINLGAGNATTNIGQSPNTGAVNIGNTTGGTAVTGTLSSTGNATIATNANTTNSFGNGGGTTTNNIGNNGVAAGPAINNIGTSTLANVAATVTNNLGNYGNGTVTDNILGQPVNINTPAGATAWSVVTNIDASPASGGSINIGNDNGLKSNTAANGFWTFSQAPSFSALTPDDIVFAGSGGTLTTSNNLKWTNSSSTFAVLGTTQINVNDLVGNHSTAINTTGGTGTVAIGNANTASITLTAAAGATITASHLDATPIGATTASTGRFTTMASTGANSYANNATITGTGGTADFTISNTSVTAGSVIILTTTQSSGTNYFTAFVKSISAGASFDVHLSGTPALGETVNLSYIIVN